MSGSCPEHDLPQKCSGQNANWPDLDRFQAPNHAKNQKTSFLLAVRILNLIVQQVSTIVTRSALRDFLVFCVVFQGLQASGASESSPEHDSASKCAG